MLEKGKIDPGSTAGSWSKASYIHQKSVKSYNIGILAPRVI